MGGVLSHSRASDSVLFGALSELATRLQRGRTIDDVLNIACSGVARLGMRFLAFQVDGDHLVLRCLTTARARHEALERMIGRSLPGLRAPLDRCGPAAAILARREDLFAHDLDFFVRFIAAATGRDAQPLDASSATAAIRNGVVAPVVVRDEPWGLLEVVSPGLRAEDAPAVALFVTHVASALEVADFVHTFERTQRELVERERLSTIGELAATVAHELRHPVGALLDSIVSLHRVLREGEGTSSRADAELLLSLVTEESARLNAIVSDLLEYARPRSIFPESTALIDVIHDVTSCLPANEAVDVRLELDPALPSFDLDVHLIRQALLSLMLQAMQAMRGGGMLMVRTRSEHDGGRWFACIDVSDTGDATGIGLRLGAVKRAVESHRGDLAVTRTCEGTTFTIRLPSGS